MTTSFKPGGPVLPTVRRLLLAGVIALAGGAVAACGALGPERGTVGSCPATAILEEPGELVRFKTGTESGPSDILFRTRMNRIGGVCDFDETEITMDLNIAMEALRGPANAEGRADFTYFVAILDSQKNVLTRQEFPMIALFERQDTEIRFTESVTVTIPRKKGDSAFEYLVYLGFEMTPAELAYRRRQITRP